MLLARSTVLALLLALAAARSADEMHAHEGRKLLQQTQSVEPVSGIKQLVVTPAPILAPTCMAFPDVSLRATRGVLCTSQHINFNVTKIICNEWKPECHQTVTESRLLDPSAPGAEPDAYTKTATAACQLLGYSIFGSGTQHMIGAAKEVCWNGKAWSQDNWWTNLVCCK